MILYSHFWMWLIRLTWFKEEQGMIYKITSSTEVLKKIMVFVISDVQCRVDCCYWYYVNVRKIVRTWSKMPVSVRWWSRLSFYSSTLPETLTGETLDRRLLLVFITGVIIYIRYRENSLIRSNFCDYFTNPVFLLTFVLSKRI